jgi:hypothetical protein
MKPIIAFFTVVLFVLTGTLHAQVSEQIFKAGAYRGVMTVTTSVDGFGESSTVLRVRGRSTGDSTMRIIGAPQLAQGTLGGSDDLPVKLFRVEFFAPTNSMIITEIYNADYTGTAGGVALNAVSVRGNSVRATAIFQHDLGELAVNYTVKLQLTRTGK